MGRMGMQLALLVFLVLPGKKVGQDRSNKVLPCKEMLVALNDLVF